VHVAHTAEPLKPPDAAASVGGLPLEEQALVDEQADAVQRWAAFNRARAELGELESESGFGAYAEYTRVTVSFLEDVIRRHGVRTIVDVACGDWNWMQTVDLEGLGVRSYIGYDVVPQIIARNTRLYGSSIVSFVQASSVVAPLPAADLVIARHFLFNLNIAHALATLERIQASGSALLLATTHPHIRVNVDLPQTREAYLGFIAQPQRAVWGYRPINLDISPFGLQERGVEHVEEILTHDESGEVCWLKLYKLDPLGTGVPSPAVKQEARDAQVLSLPARDDATAPCLQALQAHAALDDVFGLAHRARELSAPDVARLVRCFAHLAGVVVEDAVPSSIVADGLNGEELVSMSEEEVSDLLHLPRAYAQRLLQLLSRSGTSASAVAAEKALTASIMRQSSTHGLGP